MCTIWKKKYAILTAKRMDSLSLVKREKNWQVLIWGNNDRSFLRKKCCSLWRRPAFRWIRTILSKYGQSKSHCLDCSTLERAQIECLQGDPETSVESGQNIKDECPLWRLSGEKCQLQQSQEQRSTFEYEIYSGQRKFCVLCRRRFFSTEYSRWIYVENLCFHNWPRIAVL